MPTKYEQMYQLQMMLKTAEYKLKKAEDRVKRIKEQTAELNDSSKWDVT
jgi:hypothetical protein